MAISQKRLNRVKNWWGNPLKAINFVLKETRYKVKDIDYFATHRLSAYTRDILNIGHFKKKIEKLHKEFYQTEQYGLVRGKIFNHLNKNLN